MEIENFIKAWIVAGNQYNTEKYLNFYLPDAILDDVSVGKKFIAHKGIKNYFESYFIGYRTQTVLTSLTINDDSHAHIEVAFSGDFPEGEIGGKFDFTFKDGKISFVLADLL